MNDEIDYALTPDQWETLKAIRVPVSRFSALNRFVLDDLIALGLATISDDMPAITPNGRKALIRGLVKVVGCCGLTFDSRHHQTPALSLARLSGVRKMDRALARTQRRMPPIRTGHRKKFTR